MAEELQPLLDQIRKEGIEKAETEAAEILSKAKEKAAQMVREAEAKAKELLAKAETDSEVFTRRSIATLEQSARDVLITVGQGIENILSEIVTASVDEVLGIEVLEKMMVSMAKSCADQHGETRIELLVSEADQDELVKFFASKYSDKMVEGLELHVDNEILKGFKVSFADDHVYLDFTQEAIAEALSAFLRPKLADIVGRVAKKTAE
ncbi:MAG: ATPase [Kiritimatiellales bacterium]|nr:ATPase [Kiritimatiellota bacterium]MBL7012008.1 ATPase [Kiritimatiellales bacterium]